MLHVSVWSTIYRQVDHSTICTKQVQAPTRPSWMKLAALFSLTSLSFVSGSTRTFTPTNDAFNNPVCMTVVKFNGGTTGELLVCPSGDCINGQTIKVSLAHLSIFDETGRVWDEFTIASAEWSDITKNTVDGLDVSMATYTATLQNSKTVTLTAKVFHASGTAKITAVDSVPVHAGAVKFSVHFPTWPSSNPPQAGQIVKLILNLEGKTSSGATPQLTMTRYEEVPNMRTVFLGENMFMNAPYKARLNTDDSDTTIRLILDSKAIWLHIPSFTELRYDSVIGSTDPSAAKPSPVVFKAPHDTSNKPVVLMAVNFVHGQTGKFVICTSGDCSTGQTITVSLVSVKWMDDSGAAQEALAIPATEWSTISTAKESAVDIATATYSAVFDSLKTFTCTATIFYAEATTTSAATQSITAPAGALKLSLEFDAWPFGSEASTNMEIKMKFEAKSKMAGTVLPKAILATKSGLDKIKSLQLGEGMYVDTPTVAKIDDATTDSDITVSLSEDGSEVTLLIPKFTKFKYDMLTGSTDASATYAPPPTPPPTPAAVPENDRTLGPAPVPSSSTPEPSTITTPTPSPASVMVIASTLAVAAAALAYTFF